MNRKDQIEEDRLVKDQKKSTRHKRVFESTGEMPKKRLRLDGEEKIQRNKCLALRHIGMGLESDIPTGFFKERNFGIPVPEAAERVSWRMTAATDPLELRFFGEPRDAGPQALQEVPDGGVTVFQFKTDADGTQTFWVLCVFSTYALAERCMDWTNLSVAKALDRKKGIVHGVNPSAAKIGLLICDEGHRLKNIGGSKTLTALAALPTARRIGCSDERCSRERETRAAVTREFLTGTSAVRSLNCGSRFRQKLLCQRFAVAVCTDLERADQNLDTSSSFKCSGTLLPSCLNELSSAAQGYSTTTSTIQNLAAWSGEGADHSGGGIPGLTDTFRSSFYYATQIGSLPQNGVELMARQCLSGGDYELLQRFSNASFAPNPDFYILWLTRNIFKQGARTFNVTSSAPPIASGLQIFAFESSSTFDGTTALLIINSHTQNTYYLSQLTSSETNVTQTTTEFHLTGDVTAVHGPVSINGHIMTGDLPSVASLGVTGGSIIIVQPASLVFVII